MEAFLRVVLPMILGRTQFKIRQFQNKDQLLKRLPTRLQGYAQWITADYKIVVLVDRDNEDCEKLKAQLEQMALNASLATRSQPAGGQFTVINRIVIEELEAWYFGDWQAVQKAYPRRYPVHPGTITIPRPRRDSGRPWEHFEPVLQTGRVTIETACARLKPQNRSAHSWTLKTIARIAFSVFEMRSRIWSAPAEIRPRPIRRSSTPSIPLPRTDDQCVALSRLHLYLIA